MKEYKIKTCHWKQDSWKDFEFIKSFNKDISFFNPHNIRNIKQRPSSKKRMINKLEAQKSLSFLNSPRLRKNLKLCYKSLTRKEKESLTLALISYF